MSKKTEQLKRLHIEFITARMQDAAWLAPASKGFWQWYKSAPLNQVLSVQQLHILAEDILAKASSEELRSDVRMISEAVIAHPINDNTQLKDLIDSKQVADFARYIGKQKAQREALIHEVIGNQGFAAMLSQTLSHAITDYLDNNIGKVAGVGKLVKFGKGALEKATNAKLDEGLNTYLNKNISNITRKTESIAKKHLDDARIEKIILDGWQRAQNKKVSEIQRLTDDDSITHAESLVHDGYNHIRQSTFLQTQVKDAVSLWYEAHQEQSVGEVAAILSITDDDVVKFTQDVITPALAFIAQSEWLEDVLNHELDVFYNQPTVTKLLSS